MFADDADGLGLGGSEVAETALAESMTGWLTVADVGGGGATDVSSRKRWLGCSHARLAHSDYVDLLGL